MPFTANSITTGLLGYKLKKEFLGDGIFYREVEVFDYEIFATPIFGGSTSFTDIETNIKSAFAGYSGDIQVKNLGSPAEFQFPNDHLRVGKFNVQVEIRKPLANPSTYSPELLGAYYKGFDSNFFVTYGAYFNDFREDFEFEQSENGHDTYSHNISFSLQSGNKTTASAIAQTIFASDKDTTFGISAFIGGATTVANTGTFRNYYAETYDLARNSYSFTKKRETLPVTASTYNYDLGHVINFKEDGVVDVTERGSIQGKIDFSQALAGYLTQTGGAYTRCNLVFSNYKNFVAGSTVSDTLPNFVLTSSRTYDKPNLNIDYELTFSSNPNISAGISTDKTMEIELNENRFVNITHSYNFTPLVSPISANMDLAYIQPVQDAYNNSPAEVTGYYQASSLYSSDRPNMKRIKMSSSAGNRKKALAISMSYTNNPTYFVTLDNVEYAILEYRMTDTKPSDIISEYKVINRPTKSSVLNYAYQTEKGSKTISVTAKIGRGAANIITTPWPDLSANLLSLYKYAVTKALENMSGISIIAMTYFLSDVKYKVTSDNEIGVDVTITYSLKKYKA